MKNINIKKCPDTNDKLNAFRAYLEKKYENPSPPPTLLEAAEAVVGEWWTTLHHVGYEKIADLENAIAREKAKSVRNCDRFATQEEAVAEFLKICDRECESCKDVVAWLYEEADKEKMK